MRSLELKSVSMLLDNKTDKKATYLDLIKLSVEASPRGGFNVEDMSMRLKIRSKAEKASENGSILNLEDAEADSLNTYVKNCPWGVIHEDIVQFAEDVKNMETVDG